MKKIINFVLDLAAFLIAIVLVIFYRAERQSGKIRNYLKRK